MSRDDCAVAFAEYTRLDVGQVAGQLHTSQDAGLTAEDAHQRQQQHGPNEIEHGRVTWVHLLVRQFRSTFIYLLIAAAGIALVLGEMLDGIMILLFVCINAVLGFIQEYRSDQTLKLLKAYVVHQARVRRNAKETLIPSRDLVPGDVVILETGDLIPADLRFVLDENVTVDESVLTGESEPVQKHAAALTTDVREPYQATNIGFQGTVLVSGHAEGFVIATGSTTVLGSIAHLASETERVSAFTKGINDFSRFILRLIVATLVLVMLAHLIIKPGETSFADLLIFAIALAVGVIPEALPVVMTFSLSRGAMKLAHSKVVVKRLAAIEDLGSVQVLCTDKTGTLTENHLSVAEISGNANDVLLAASLAASEVANAGQTPNNAFDMAIEAKLSGQQRATRDAAKRLDEIPFDPERRRNSVIIQTRNETRLIVRGAPEAVIAGTDLSPQDRATAEAWIVDQGKRGRRVIAVAGKATTHRGAYTADQEEHGLRLVGLIAFVDPIKKTTASAIRTARNLDVKVKILTGDRPEVAGVVAAEVGIAKSSDAVITGEAFSALPPDEQDAALDQYAVFARVSPEQKYAIIQRLQKRYEVGFLGEGINDAPALKIADVGLVVKGAADVAQQAADIVLLNQSLNVIMEGIRIGRMTFANTIKYIKTTLASNFGNFYAVAISSLFIPFLPMLPLQILLLNLLSDFPMIAIAADRVDANELRSPRSYDVRDLTLVATLLGLVSTVFDFIFFGLFRSFGQEILQTNWFIGSILTELLLIFSLRTRRVFWRGRRPSRVLVVLSATAFLITIVLPWTSFGQDVFHFTTPKPGHLAIILGVVAAYFVSTESAKLAYYRLLGNGSRRHA